MLEIALSRRILPYLKIVINVMRCRWDNSPLSRQEMRRQTSALAFPYIPRCRKVLPRISIQTTNCDAVYKNYTAVYTNYAAVYINHGVVCSLYAGAEKYEKAGVKVQTGILASFPQQKAGKHSPFQIFALPLQPYLFPQRLLHQRKPGGREGCIHSM